MQKIQIATTTTANTGNNITDRIKSFEDACQVLNIKGDLINGEINEALSGDAKSISAYMKLIIIARALNEGWTPDWKNGKQAKFYQWFDLENGFVFYLVDGYYSASTVGSRLCFKNSELATYAAKQFESLYKDYFII